MKKNKTLRYGLLVIVSMLMAITPLSQGASAVVLNDYTWQITYSASPNTEWDPAEGLERSIHVVSDGGHISFDLGLAVDVYQYKHDAYQHYNYITFKASTFFSSEAEAPYVAAVADRIVLYVQKMDSRYYSSQAISVLGTDGAELVPNAAGADMMHPSNQVYPAEYSTVWGFWGETAKNAITAALGVVPGLGDIASYMCDLVELYGQDATDAQSASFSSSSVTAWSNWIHSTPGAYPVAGETVKQECFQVFDWRQADNLNPSTWMRIKVYAGLLIDVPTWEYSEFSAFNYYTSPIYLTIYHMPTGSGGGCPFLSVYDGSGYADEGLMDIHNPDGEDVVYTQVLSSRPCRIDGQYRMRLTEHPQTISHIDQVRLYGLLPNGRLVLLPLLMAEHSTVGDMRGVLWRSDDARAILLGADHTGGESEYIDLRFLAPGHDRFIQYQFIIEGNNVIVKE